jgi:hypothetical protein
MKTRILAVAVLWAFGPLPTYACPDAAATAAATASRGCVDLTPSAFEPVEPAVVPAPSGSNYAAVRSRDCVDGFCAEPGTQPGRAGKSVKVQAIAPDGRVIPDR